MNDAPHPPTTSIQFHFPLLTTYEPDLRLPKLWSSEVDCLMGRTSRAYALVCRYRYKCPDGTRWADEAIEAIRDAGKHMEDDMRVLDGWRRTAAAVELVDETMMRKIADDVEHMEVLCSRINDMINEYEVVPHNYIKAEGFGLAGASLYGASSDKLCTRR